MSYTIRDTQTVRGQETIYYPASEKGGSRTVTIDIPVTIEIEVDTRPFDISVDNAKLQVNILNGAVVATESAEVAVIHESSEKISSTVIKGFFDYIRSDISQQISEYRPKVEAMFMQLLDLQKSCHAKQAQMVEDFGRISERYAHIFNDLDKETGNRIKALNQSAFTVSLEIDNHISSSIDGKLSNTSTIFNSEGSSAHSQLFASGLKNNALSLINKAKQLIMSDKYLGNMLKSILIPEQIGKNALKYLPVVFCEVINEDKKSKSILKYDSNFKGFKFSTFEGNIERSFQLTNINWQPFNKNKKIRLAIICNLKLVNLILAQIPIEKEFRIWFGNFGIIIKHKVIKDNFMEELKEIRVNDNRIMLNNNLVKSSILPKIIGELERDIVIQGNCVIEGAVYARNLEIQQGPIEIQGAVFTQLEMHVNNDAKGVIKFRKTVGSSNAIISYAPGCQLIFMADVNAKQIKLCNAFVSGSIFADEVILENCVVIGGVFCTRSLEINNCIIGTFNCPSVKGSKSIYLLLPSAFSVEKISILPGTELYNLSLADLGSLYQGTPQTVNSGKIRINLESDELKTVLTGDGVNQTLRSYSVVGKVLAADLIDTDKLNNHFLITAASLGSQLLKTYNLNTSNNDKPIELTTENLVAFFFDILHGKMTIQNLQGNFELKDIVDNLN